MSHDTSRIYTETVGGVKYGVSIADIQTILGLGNKDIGGLIVQGVAQAKINKWAKYKPIHYPGKYILEDADFRGRNTDYNDYGLVYGLKVPNQISVIDPAAFHATSWDYLGYPNATGLPGTSMYRFLDFNGYNARAVPNIYGQIPETSKFYVNTTVAISTAYSSIDEGFIQNNPDGVDLARFVVGLSPDDDDSILMQNLSKCYPAILIGNYLTGVGVYNSGQMDYNTIVRSNGSGGYVISSPNWCVDMTKLAAAMIGEDYAPWTSTTNTVATLVLVYTASAYPRLINGDPTSDLTAKWFDLTEERAWTARIFPLPGATGIPITVTPYEAGITVTPISASYLSGNVLITCTVTRASTETRSGTSVINVRAKTHGSGQYGGDTGTRTVQIPANSTTNIMVTFTPNDFGMAEFVQNTQYDVEVTTLTTVDGTQITTDARGEFTFTARNI